MKLKSLFSIFIFLGMVLILPLNVTAQDEGGEEPKKEKKKKKPKKARKPLEDLTHSGTIMKKERKNKKGDVIIKYILKTADTKIMLPKAKKKAENPIDYSKYVDKEVTIKGKGMTRTKKNKKGVEKTTVRYKKVTSIEEGAAAAEGEGENKEEEKKEE